MQSVGESKQKHAHDAGADDNKHQEEKDKDHNGSVSDSTTTVGDVSGDGDDIDTRILSLMPAHFNIHNFISLIQQQFRIHAATQKLTSSSSHSPTISSSSFPSTLFFVIQ